MRILFGSRVVQAVLALLAPLAFAIGVPGCGGPTGSGQSEGSGLRVRTEVIGPAEQVLILPSEDTDERPLFFIKETYVKATGGEKRERGMYWNPVGPGNVVFRGHVGPEMDQVPLEWGDSSCGTEKVAISDDGRRFGYLARKGDDWLVYIDGNEVARYSVKAHGHEFLPEIPGAQGLQFSPGGRRYSYSVNSRDGNEYVVVDGRPETPHPKMHYPGPYAISLVFSPDGNRYAYTAWTRDQRTGRGCVVVVDGLPGREYENVGHVNDGIGDPVFSPDSRHVGYVGFRDGNDLLVIDGNEVAHGGELRGPYFTRDGAHVVCFACDWSRPGGTRYYLDGRMLPPTKAVRTYVQSGSPACDVIDLKAPLHERRGELYPSPDRRRYAYRHIDANGEHVRLVVDGEPGPWFDEIEFCGCGNGPTFSPDSAHLACIAKRGGKSFVVLDEEAGPEFDDVEEMQFASDSGELVYSAMRDGRWVLVRQSTTGDGGNPGCAKTTEFSANVHSLWFFLSRDGRHMGHIQLEDACPEMAAFLDGQLVGRYDRVGR